MKKRIKSLIALGLAMTMLVACGSTSTGGTTQESTVTSSESATDTSTEVVESKYPEYLNLDGYRPIVKEGNDITISMAVQRSQNAETEAEETWLYQFIEEKFNIGLDVETMFDTERKSIIMASGDLPDIMVNIGIGSTDILNYGVRDGMFLNLLDYASEELTPNLWANLQKYEDYMDYYISDNGAMYGVPLISNYQRFGYGDTSPVYRCFYDQRYMEAAGWDKVPETLDEFLQFCRDVKALDPKEMGVDEIWPVCDQYNYLWAYLQTAFGWVTSNWASYVSALWDADQGKMVIPCMDDKFQHFVEVFNIMYEEGLIHPDFLSMDTATSSAMLSAGQCAVVCSSNPSTFNYAGGTEEDWLAGVPLTSEWNEEPVAAANSICDGPYVFISADTEHPEVVMRLIDWMCSEEGAVYLEWGPPAGSEDTMGIIGGFEYNESKTGLAYVDVNNGKCETNDYCRNNLVTFMKHNIAFRVDSVLTGRKMLGEENPQYAPLSKTNPAYTIAEATNGKLMQTLKSVVMDDDTRATYSDLRSSVNTYVKQEVAKFIVGQRDITDAEWDAFQAEISKAGGEDYSALLENYYKDAEEPLRLPAMELP